MAAEGAKKLECTDDAYEAAWRRARNDQALRGAFEGVDRSVRRARLLLRPALARRKQAERFCRHVNVEGARNPTYQAAGEALRRFRGGELSAGDLCEVVNRGLTETFRRAIASAPPEQLQSPWTLTNYRGPHGRTRFTFDRGIHWLDAWGELALLLNDGATLDRLRVCKFSKCGRLFYDASPRGDRTACSKQHKDVLGQRALRKRRAHQHVAVRRHRTAPARTRKRGEP